MQLSLRDIARLAGVSPATVSRVYSGSRPVAPKTRQRILDLAAEHGFRPSAIGQAAFGGRTRSIGVLLPDLAVSFFADIAGGLQQELLQADYLPMILERQTSNTDRRAIQRLLDHRVDGMLLHLIDEALLPQDFALVMKAGLPIVLIGVIHPTLNVDIVTNDDRTGAREIGAHLLELGHRRLGFVYFGAGHSASDLRLAGFRDALGRNGLVLREQDMARYDPFDSDRDARLHAELLRILRQPDRPTAIFAPADNLAGKVYRAARELGLRIPTDLSVAGFANLNFSPLTDPPLTTVDQLGAEVGRRAARLMLDRIAHPNRRRRTEIVATQLIVRASTAPPPGGSRRESGLPSHPGVL
jgi:DNA-binding LacI/PurR family transcriptional regulator